MSKIFSFPNPVNETAARVVAGGVATMAASAAALDQPWLMYPLVYGFAARVAAGPRFSPLGLLATRVVAPRLPVEHRYSPGPPKRLAQGMGLGMSGVALLLHFRRGHSRGAKLVLSCLAVAAGLEAAFGFCLGCKLFALAMKIGLVPQSVCEECNDIWARASNQPQAPAA